MTGKQSAPMDKAEKLYKKELADGNKPNVGAIARKYELGVSAIYKARWYLELKALEKKDGS